MAFEAAFLELMKSTASLRRPTTDNFYGEDTAFGTAQPFPCHITYRTKIMRKNTDQEIVSSAEIQMPPGGYLSPIGVVPTVHSEDRITLVDNDERLVISVNTYFDEDGTPHHQTVALT